MGTGIISVLASVDGGAAVFYTGGQASGRGGKFQLLLLPCCPFSWRLLILEIGWSSVWEILFWRKVQY